MRRHRQSVEPAVDGRTQRGDDHPTVVVDEMQTLAQARRDRAVRRIIVAALVAFVVAGMLGFLGYRQSETGVRADGPNGAYDVRLSYPQRTRGGLPARWELTVERFDGELPALEIRTTADYLDLFDFNSLTPEPDTVEQADDVIWTFAPSEAASTTIVLDIRTQPGSRWRHPATTTVLADGEVVAILEYETLVVP